MAGAVISDELAASLERDDARRGLSNEEPAVADAPAPEEAPVRRMASRDMIPDELVPEEFTLPVAQVIVVVRGIDTPEMSEMLELPDLLGYRTLQVDLAALRSRLAELGDEEEGLKIAREEIEARAGSGFRHQIEYFATIAHLAIADPDAGEEEELCACGLTHPPSLWSVRQCRRLNPKDLEAVADFALRGLRLGRLGFSSDQTAASDTQPSAAPGE